MKTAVLLAAGNGTRIWPYASVRPKALIPVSNRPLAAWLIDDLLALGYTRIIIAAGPHAEQFRNCFRHLSQVEVAEVGPTRGTAESLQGVLDGRPDHITTVLYADVLAHRDDLARLSELDDLGALVTPHTETSRNHIGCSIAGGCVEKIVGHAREGTTHHFLGFRFPAACLPALGTTSNRFPSVEVGVMVPEERFLEATMVDLMEEGRTIRAVETTRPAFDLDKPWHILEANAHLNRMLCDSLTHHQLGEGASISESAEITGAVRLGRNSSIGRNVVIEGNIWVGDDSHIRHGAILKGDIVVGDQAEIAYGCYIERGSTVGHRCKVLHGAELSGIVLHGVYLYHYMEIAGIVGENTDIGAGTVCGSLRFDDGMTVHRIKGRIEQPAGQHLANACYIGDYARTGINACLMPGVKTGARSIVGPGVVLGEDLDDNTAVFVKQEHIRRPWGAERYGW